MSGLPRLYVYKRVSGSATLLLNVQLAGDQANQPFTTFIRNDGPNPGLHLKLGFSEWHVSDTSITSGYPGYAFTDGTNAQYIPGTYALARGLWKHLGLSISAADIAEARKEMWGNFPREQFFKSPV